MQAEGAQSQMDFTRAIRIYERAITIAKTQRARDPVFYSNSHVREIDVICRVNKAKALKTTGKDVSDYAVLAFVELDCVLTFKNFD